MKPLKTRKWWIFAMCAWLLGLAQAAAGDPAQPIPQALQAREARLASQLRCVVCQNQTVAESNAPLAADMRRVIRSQLQAGHTDQEIVDFFAQRYGAFVHYVPPFQASTWLLWLGPFALAIAGLAALAMVLRRRVARDQPIPLTEAQRARARQLLQEESPP